MLRLVLRKRRAVKCLLCILGLCLLASEINRIIWKFSLHPSSGYRLGFRSKFFAEQAPREDENAYNNQDAVLAREKLAIRFEERRQRVQRICKRVSLTKQPGVRNTSDRFVFPTNSSPVVLFCPVPKTGTTFLKKVFAVANHRRDNVQWIERFNVRPVDDFQEAVMFFFTREPYSRMFSAYVDKLWAPNLEFWRVLGRNVKLAMRPNSSKSLECGHDVTFPEVIRYVIKGLEEGVRINSHFMPTHTFCEACDYDYDYIGHLETFREDAGYILNAINITTTRGLSFDNDTLRDYVVQAYYTFLIGKRTKACATKEEILLRSWRALQLRGLISMELTFPVPRNAISTLRQHIFKDLVFKAAAQSEAIFAARDQQSGQSNGQPQSRGMETGQSKLIPKARDEQRQMALSSAYSLIPLADKERLSELLRAEFELFGYPRRPGYIFDPPAGLDKRIFDLETV